ncbi:hypothetical protein VOLCADRAFT_118442 [Volvox carteri f. nagariensis]|uniref:RRM domain-containing protein n=1 Tax=Volvox carteri f. nagariensis TaxID=3068 RepID=D8U4W3_VOLCA|nr:uncharacterized protein VOLCADRAFT_118442 [Volvox carteri f. nagariensis]EFJ45259.1 hypothetical protein VOLCADRAFT_118442 [Volvox carteri f. nagariensis]|eukprot:XP_002953635.1 hypothetical protein VOLCADRAFT_118442 [Volvox carteri f. nagariensis]
MAAKDGDGKLSSDVTEPTDAEGLKSNKGKASSVDAPNVDSGGGNISSDDSEDGSDDSSGDIDVDAETAQQLMALEHELQINVSYEKHLEYIALLRTAPGLRKRLRDAHEDLAARFPLSEELWLAWINDELSAVSGPEDLAWLLGLLRRAATRDYLAPAVWELYLEVAHDLDPAVRDLEPEGVERYRAICEEALAAAGLHLAAGHRLWSKYRTFELAVEARAAGGTSAAAARQQDRVRALYQRQLQVPLQDVDQTLEEYKAWEAGHGKSVPAHVVKAADKAREAAELRAGFEEGVAAEVPADVSKLGAFLSYIKMEQNAGDTARVQVLYERAVAAFPLTYSLWLQYGQYMETHTKLAGPINAVYGRAVRNCPWVAAVWERAIRALDRTGAPLEAVDEMYGNALKAGLQHSTPQSGCSSSNRCRPLILPILTVGLRTRFPYRVPKQAPDDYLAIILSRIDCLRRAAVAAKEAAAAGGGSGTGGGGSSKKEAAAAAAAVAAAFSRLRLAFCSATELMMSHFPDHLDLSLSLPAYWAQCEMYVMCDTAAAREVWEGSLKGGLGRYAEAWEAYIAMERSARLIKEARALYKRCYSRRLEQDGQLKLCQAWLRFEREEGRADDYLQALLKVEPILEESAAAAATAADQAAAAAAKAAVQKAKNLSKDEVKAMRRAKDPNFKGKKDTAEKGEAEMENPDKGGKPAKRGRHEDGQDPAPVGSAEELASIKRVRMHEPEAPSPRAKAGAQVPTDNNATAPAAAAEGGDQDADMADEEEAHADGAADANAGAEGMGEDNAAGPGPGTAKTQGGARPHYTDKMTVFIRGLLPGVKDVDLEGFLKGHVPEGLKDSRIMRDAQTGDARGFAYVECSSREALDKLVALNGTVFQGKSLFIAESKPPKHGGGGRGPPHGGGGRGRFSGGRFGGPPGARGGGFAGRGRGRGRGGGGGSAEGDPDTEMEEAGDGGGGGGGGGGRGGRGGHRPGLGHPSGRGSMRTHLQISQGSAPPTALVPRSLQLSVSFGAPAGGDAGSGGGGGAAAGGQQLSNDDFRRMLLSGKK